MKGFLSNYFNDVRIRWRLVADKSVDRERRIFAALELVCFPISILMLFVFLPLRIVAAQTGWFVIAGPLACAFDILLSAAIGYITNYIAIEMLFKPYHEDRRHPLSIVSFGYWKQGLVPKNKAQIGAELGRQIETRLLKPDQLADELCKTVMELLQDKENTAKIRSAVKKLLENHEDQIVAFLVPRIEESLCGIVREHITTERLSEVLDNTVIPQLKLEGNRKLAARNILDCLKRRSPELVATLKSELRDIIYDYISNKLPLLPAGMIADGIVAVIDWEDVEVRICAKLKDERTTELIKEELLGFINRLAEWIKTPEGAKKLDGMTTKLKEKIVELVRAYLREKLPALAGSVLESESLWRWVEYDFLPSVKPQLEAFIKDTGRKIIAEKLNISEKVTNAVNKQDVEEFHSMINSIAAQHLGAIQVLGFFLGALVGTAQIFIK